MKRLLKIALPTDVNVKPAELQRKSLLPIKLLLSIVLLLTNSFFPFESRARTKIKNLKEITLAEAGIIENIRQACFLLPLYENNPAGIASRFGTIAGESSEIYYQIKPFNKDLQSIGVSTDISSGTPPYSLSSITFNPREIAKKFLGERNNADLKTDLPMTKSGINLVRISSNPSVLSVHALQQAFGNYTRGRYIVNNLYFKINSMTNSESSCRITARYRAAFKKNKYGHDFRLKIIDFSISSVNVYKD